jgi:NAD(P)-dependent dehydrogenase (short-subunit alcohol dehydrogenase family)
LNVRGSTALVTGAARGIGAAFVEALLDRDARCVYAGVRRPTEFADPRVVPCRLDVTDAARVEEVAAELGEVDLVVNNAGILISGSGLELPPDEMRRLFEVNFIGLLAVSRAFAPVLRRNGGGAIVNVLSIGSWIAGPNLAVYSATKAAAWAVTNAMRIELREAGTDVIGVHVGYVDTDMVADVDAEKIAPSTVAEAALDGVEARAPEVLVGEQTEAVKVALGRDQELIYPGLQAAHDARTR